MPTVDLTPRLVRESRPGDKDTILFDRSLPAFGRMPLDRIGPEDVAARSTPARPNGPRPSPLFGCWRSPDAGGEKYSVFAGATSAMTPSICRTPRPARVLCRSVRPRGRISRSSLACGAPMRSYFRDTPKAGAKTALSLAGGRCARMQGSVGCGCMTCDIPPQVMPSCRARICRSSANCSGTGGIRSRQATPTLSTIISSRRPRR